MADVVLIVNGPMARDDIPDWCERVQGLVRASDDDVPIVCDVSELAPVDATSVDGLARMQLTARRLGTEIHLRGASERLCSLLALFGLAEALPLCRRLEQLERLSEALGEAEEREQGRGVEEEVQPDDPSL